jgi:hypothetical protein
MRTNNRNSAIRIAHAAEGVPTIRQSVRRRESQRFEPTPSRNTRPPAVRTRAFTNAALDASSFAPKLSRVRQSAPAATICIGTSGAPRNTCSRLTLGSAPTPTPASALAFLIATQPLHARVNSRPAYGAIFLLPPMTFHSSENHCQLELFVSPSGVILAINAECFVSASTRVAVPVAV